MNDPSPATAPTTPEPLPIIPATKLLSTAALPPPPPCDTLPERIGRYRILSLLGQGGMGSVYLAEDTQLQRRVALKVPRFAADIDPAILERFYREARTAARLQHPNICPVFDVDQVDGTHYLTMAFIEGDTLAKQVSAYGQKPPRDAVSLVRTLALALDEAHRMGIIHRDLKPSNVMINNRGEPIVMDFGLAREIQSSSIDLSAPGMVMGTPSYMAPEQARGDQAAIGPSCDIYSLGIVLYQLLVGELPFQGTMLDVIGQHLHVPPPRPSLRRPDLDSAVEAICLKAIAKEASQRFLSMAEFAAALQGYLEEGQRLVLAPPEEDAAIERAIAEVLHLLRTWGWDSGARKIRGRLEEAARQQSDARIALLLRWINGDPEAEPEARQSFSRFPQFAALHGWVLCGRAYQHWHRYDREVAAGLVERAIREGDPRDPILKAVIVIGQAAITLENGRHHQALQHILHALEMLGRDHFLTGRLFDLLGLVYAKKNNLDSARESHEQAILSKQRFGDERSVATTHNLLGWLFVDWDDLDQAQEHFQKELELSQKTLDEEGQLRAYNGFGHVRLMRGLQSGLEASPGHARKHLQKAAEWLDAGIRGHQARGNRVLEAFAQRDRGLVCIADGDLDGAEEHFRAGEELFRQQGHEAGVARVDVGRGILARSRGQMEEARRCLRRALAWFDRNGKPAEAARAQLEVARTMVAARELSELISQAYLEALRRAEDCRRERLVRLVEEELAALDEERLAKHRFQRARGRGAPDDTDSLSTGERESATLLFVTLHGFTSLFEGYHPRGVMRTLNQVMGDLSDTLQRHGGIVTSFLGGTFLGMVLGNNHAVRAVQASLDLLAVVADFNRPRGVLGLRQLPVAVGVASGSVFVGNIGTYHKMDFTAARR